MAGASFLYNSLSKNYKPDTLVVENQASEENTSSKENSQYNNSSSQENSKQHDSSSKENSQYNDSSSQENSKQYNSSSQENSQYSDSSSQENSKQHASSSQTENKLQIAPDFTVYDLTGNLVNLSDFFGKPIILNFWASWCGPCQMEMPDFNIAYDNYKNDIEFLMINMTDGSRETIEIASSFIQEKEYTFPVYYDTQYNATMIYSVTSLPTTYFINADGELVAHAKGAIDADTLQRGINMILSTNSSEN